GSRQGIRIFPQRIPRRDRRNSRAETGCSRADRLSRIQSPTRARFARAPKAFGVRQKTYLLHQPAGLGVEPRPHRANGALVRPDALHFSLRGRALQSLRSAHDFCRTSDDRKFERAANFRRARSKPDRVISRESFARSPQNPAGDVSYRQKYLASKTGSAFRDCSRECEPRARNSARLARREFSKGKNPPNAESLRW